MQIWVLDRPEDISVVHREAAETIIGYSSESFPGEDNRRSARLQNLFQGQEMSLPPSSLVIAAIDEETGSRLLGGAIVEAFAPPELIRKDIELARAMARTHFVLAALFVHPAMRGQGLGAALLDCASEQVVRHQGRYLDGFVDDRNQSAEFYQRAGAVVGAPNEGLPARRPTNAQQRHVGDDDGHWFYVDALARHHDLILCSRCVQPVIFHAEDGGWVECPRCPMP